MHTKSSNSSIVCVLLNHAVPVMDPFHGFAQSDTHCIERKIERRITCLTQNKKMKHKGNTSTHIFAKKNFIEILLYIFLFFYLLEYLI